MAQATENSKAQTPTIFRNSEVAIMASVVGIIMVMVIPLPSQLLDVLLAFNITISILILFVAMYASQPLDFSVFPTVLLFATLFRLSLNVASTRLILLHGNEGPAAAGQVIKSFGSFVVGGNFVVGLIVFLILVIINFVVITKGAGRVAEVAARFTLDAMPGKQMSIDADLNAGLVNDDEARSRRKKVEEEADFYGAMDGASKFVRGDAIAGIIITMINIVGGLIIGVLQNKMAIGDASRVYTLLTVGDGLVTQLPALIISTASGVIVTRAATGNKLGDEIIKQVMVQPRALGIASGVVIILGLVPGLPTLPFVLLAALMGMIAYLTQQSRKTREKQEMMEKDKEDALPAPENVVPLLHPDLLGLEVGYGLIPLVDSEKGGDLLGRIRAIRRQCAMEMGVIVPPLHIKDNFQLKSHEYTIMIKGMEVARGELMSNHLLAMDQGNVETEMQGIKTEEPTFGLPALWINDKDKEKAKLLGYTVVDHSTVVATHISEIMKGHAYELLGRQEVQELLDTLGEKYPKAVDELVPNLLTLGNVQKVLQNLLKERISIRDLLTIVEALADNAIVTKDVDLLTEAVRQSMSRTITRQYMESEGTLPAIVIDQGLEETIQGALQKSEHGAYLALDPTIAQKILNSIKDNIEKLLIEGHQPVVLCSPVVRPYLKRLTERFLPKLAVMSYAEIEPDTEIRSVGEVGLDETVSTPTS